MALGRQRPRQADMVVTWGELPRSPGHIFYDRLQSVLIQAAFDGFVEGLYAIRLEVRAVLRQEGLISDHAPPPRPRQQRRNPPLRLVEKQPDDL